MRETSALPPDLPPVERVGARGTELGVRRLPALRSSPEAAGRPRRLLFLHGGPGLDHHLLLPLGLALAGPDEVWLADLPGHGASVAPSGKLPGLAALETRLASWLRAVDGGFDALVGHSLGAWLLLRWLRRCDANRPPRAGAVVLMAPPAAGQERAGTALRRAVAAIGEAGGESLRSGGRTGRTWRARREVRAHVEAETRGAASPAFREALERTRLRDPRRYRALLRSFHRAVTGPVRPVAPGCPVLVVCGEEDLTTPPEQAIRVARSVAGAHLELIRGAGHYPWAERPGETARLLRAFLDQALAGEDGTGR